jgi:diacylglycerol kinase (ATP)
VPSSLVIVNPAASGARSGERRASLVARLDTVLTARDGERPRVLETRRSGEATDVVRDAVRAGVASVVGVGGDGTLREIADALRDTAVPLGIVPAGTGNLFGGIIGVPTSAEAAIDALGEAGSARVDLGLARMTITSSEPAAGQADGAGSTLTTESIFAIACSLGFDARVMATTPPDLKRRFGRAAYFVQAARLATNISSVPYRIRVDDRLIETEASVAMVTNMGQLIPGRLGPRMPILHDDGLLDVIVVGARGFLHGLRGLVDQLARTTLGGESGADSLRLRGREVAIEADRPEPAQLDGDHVGWGRLEARVLPGALVVLVPITSASPGADGPATREALRG